MLTLLLGSITAVSICWSSLADTPVSPATAGTEWTLGPTTGALGSLGEIKVPSGFRFLDAQGARAFLAGHNLTAPRDLLGVLAPNSTNWWAVLQATDQGYSQHPEADLLDPAEILKTLSTASASQGQAKAAAPAAPAPSLAWELTPNYDAQTRTLEWAVRKQSASQPVVVQAVRLLCRRGSVDATVVAPYRGFSDLAPLKTLVQNISLKAGERYEDYRQGDKLCGVGLAALVKDEAPASVQSAMAGSRGSQSLWLGGAGASCAIVLGGAWFYARGSRRKPRRNCAPEREAQAALAPAPAGKAANPPLASGPTPAPVNSAPAQNGVRRHAPKAQPAASGFHPRTETLRKPLNGKNHGPRRRKVFDYNRYFTDLMGAVSAHSAQMEAPAANGAAVESARFALPPSEVESAAMPSPAAALDQQAELLAGQRELIAEQKRLIQEQNNLIEEKSRLIAEKNELLKLQNQLMADKLI